MVVWKAWCLKQVFNTGKECIIFGECFDQISRKLNQHLAFKDHL